jgi:transposase
MGRKTRISQKEAIKAEEVVKSAIDAQELRKAQSILLPALFSLDLVATSIAIGRSKATVCRLQAEFRAGTETTTKKRRGGRRRQNLSLEQETQLLEPFFQKASEGQAFDPAEIHSAYESAVGKKVPASTIYRMLARHGWHAPRSKGPKDQD